MDPEWALRSPPRPGSAGAGGITSPGHASGDDEPPVPIDFKLPKGSPPTLCTKTNKLKENRSNPYSKPAGGSYIRRKGIDQETQVKHLKAGITFKGKTVTEGSAWVKASKENWPG